MKKVDLSIIIPCYNAEKYIARSLDSIVLEPQKKIKIEIIVVNDGSTDSSFKILEDYNEKYHNLYLINQSNKGVSNAINAGLDVFNGEYVFVLAADDWCNLDSILESLQIAKKKELDLCGFGMNYYNENLEHIGFKMKQPIKYNTILNGRKVLEQGYQPSSICVFLMHKNFFKEKDLRFISGITQNDVEISNRLLLSAKRVYYTDYIGYNYFRHSESITLTSSSSRRKKYLNDSIIVATKIKQNISNYNLKEKSIIKAITINYNNVVWNLIWRFYRNPEEVDYEFKLQCLEKLKAEQLYPIKGPLKTNFQNLSRYFFNQEFLLKWILKK